MRILDFAERGHSCPLGGRKQSNGQESLRGHCRTERRKDRWFGNPKGIVSSSPAAESARLPWVSIRAILNPNDSAPSPPTGHNRWGWPTPPAFPSVARGSQPWALGRNPSLWDSALIIPKGIGSNPSGIGPSCRPGGSLGGVGSGQGCPMPPGFDPSHPGMADNSSRCSVTPAQLTRLTNCGLRS